ncbi:MAG TPA: YihY/virulence factor BrkB family protein [Terrimesophilobacter sp.]|nr:YihY/virulence factor BrkB family protein [Terrimesophilobacter sp.]
MPSIKKAIAWVLALKPVRVFRHFADRRGFLLSGGLSYQSLFAVFAAIWVGFAAFGLILKGNPALGGAFFDTIARSVPGLLAWRGAEGVIDPDQLTQVEILGWTGAIAAVGLLLTALGWLSSTRDAVRALFDLPGEQVNFLLLKLKDLGLAIGFGAALLLSSALSVFSTQALDTTLGWFGIREDSMIAAATGRAIGLALMLLLDTIVLGTLYRVLSGLTIPIRRLLVGSVLGAVVLGVLKVLGGALLGGAGRNPLLASFAIIVGLLIWFNLVCAAILLGASWIAVGMADAGIAADPKVAAARREAERVALARKEAELAAIAARQRGWFSRILRRDRSRDSGPR